MLKLSGLALLLLVITGCATPSPETNDQRGRAAWQRAFAEASWSYTVRYQDGLRAVITNVSLEDDQYCYTLLATRGTARHSDFWVNYGDSIEPPPRSCARYLAVNSIRRGDPRGPRPTREELDRQQELVNARIREANRPGRALWDRVLSSPSDVYTVQYQGIRLVVTDIVFESDRYCYRLLASQAGPDAPWTHHDGESRQQGCSNLVALVSVALGDGRR